MEVALHLLSQALFALDTFPFSGLQLQISDTFFFGNSHRSDEPGDTIMARKKIAQRDSTTSAVKAEDSSPDSTNSAVKAEDGSPDSTNSAVKAEDSSPVSTNSAVKAEDDSPAPTNSAVKAEDSSPDPTNSAIKAEDSSPDPTNSAIKAEDSSPDPTNSAIKAEDSSPDSTNSAIKAEDIHPSPAAEFRSRWTPTEFCWLSCSERTAILLAMLTNPEPIVIVQVVGGFNFATEHTPIHGAMPLLYDFNTNKQIAREACIVFYQVGAVPSDVSIDGNLTIIFAEQHVYSILALASLHSLRSDGYVDNA